MSMAKQPVDHMTHRVCRPAHRLELIDQASCPSPSRLHQSQSIESMRRLFSFPSCFPVFPVFAVAQKALELLNTY